MITTYRCVVFGQPRFSRDDTKRTGRVIRPVHIVASDARGWTMCKRHARNGEQLTYGRFGPMADAIAQGFICMHCASKAETLNLTPSLPGFSEVGPMYVQAPPKRTTLAFLDRRTG